MPRFDPDEIARAVALQRASYRLLRWATDGIDRGFLSTRAVHGFATLPEAAHAWIESHYENLPTDARPPAADLRPFANLFATYLDASFDLLDEPGTRLYSPEAHCFCHLCSWFVAMPRLRPKKLTRAHKDRARHLMQRWGEEVAVSAGLPVHPDVLADPSLQEDLAYGAYARELLNRTRGFSEGPAALALWRRFAWEPTGSPKKGFELTADRILAAEARVRRALAA